MIKLENLDGFEWDKGNRDKNLNKHNVTNSESEEVFFNFPILLETESANESRYMAIGESYIGRNLTVIFTIRKNKIRVISSRDSSKKEINYYEQNK
ncbi:MAG TPA: BrnT family toxin [Ignavibacteria bacterium]|nr:BrnT family toxin [Ignavibacteria bacterium]